MKARLKEASSWAGLGVVGHAVALLVSSGGVDPMAWAQLVAGITAIAIPENKTGERRARGERRKVAASA
jgi:hypothetical protein